MNRMIFGLILVVLTPALAAAQSYSDPKGQAYVYVSPGATSPGGTGTVQLGGGAEGLIFKGAGVGGELGYVTPWKDFSRGLGVLSVDGSYHFNRSAKVVPFVESGYTLFFRSGIANGINVGGGVNYWLRDHIGLRLEFRDQMAINLGDVTSHYYGFRVGLSFR